MPTTRKLVVRGIAVKTTTPRRYAVVAVRPEPWTASDGYVYPQFASVIKRTDNLDVAHATCRRRGVGTGSFPVIVNLTTGEEVQ